MLLRSESLPPTSAVGSTADPNALAVLADVPATDATTIQADPAVAVTTTTNVGGTVAAMGGGSDTTQGGPMAGWFGWSGTREPVRFQYAPSQPADGFGSHGAFVSGMAGPSEAVTSAFEKLQTDSQAIQDKSEVTPKLLAAVRNDFEAIGKGSTSDPDQAALEALATDVKAIAGQLPSDAQRAQLVADFTAVLKSQGITDQTLIDKTINDIQAVVTASNVTTEDLATLAADREAIQAAISAEAEATAIAPPLAADPVASLFAGMTGGFDSGVPTTLPYFGGVMGGGFTASPSASWAVGEVPSGEFHTLPAMDGEFHTLPAMDGEFHTLPAMDSEFHTLPAVALPAGGGMGGELSVSSVGVGAGGQSTESNAAPVAVTPTDNGVGGRSSESPVLIRSAGGGMNRRFSQRFGGGMSGRIGAPWGRASMANGRLFRA